MPIPVSDDFILYPSQQPPAPPESPQSGFSCIWTRRSVLDSSSPQPQPQPALPELSQSGFSWIWRRTSTSRSELDSFSWQPPPPVGSKLFTYGELTSATNGFSESNLMGEGGFGYVYRGFLRDYGIVAIKKQKTKNNQGAAEFRAEVHTASRLYHRHIVSLVGYYFDHQVKARLEGPLMLVYEFLPNNSLQFHLHGRGTETIDWETRMKIAVGSAKGLTYLHEDCKPRIIHRDIKPSNILLDENFQPKITDFGLAKVLPDDDTYISVSRVAETDGLAELSLGYTTRLVGTFGYLAPEYAASGRINEKSDVYAFGAVLFGLITGRKPLNDPEKYPGGHGLEWAIPLFSVALQNRNFEEFADARLGNEYNAEEMFRMVSCAANCSRLSAARRPRMSQVVQALEGVSRLDNDDLTDGYYENEETTEETTSSSFYAPR